MVIPITASGGRLLSDEFQQRAEVTYQSTNILGGEHHPVSRTLYQYETNVNKSPVTIFSPRSEINCIQHRHFVMQRHPAHAQEREK